MGWETLAIAGFTALKSYNQIQQGNAQAGAAVQQGEEQTQTAANNTVISAGKATNSFLSSGLTLEGGPMAGINQIFNTGNTNIARIAQNANNQSSNAINSARTAALATIAQGATMAAGGGAGGGMSSVDSFVSDQWNGFGQSFGRDLSGFNGVGPVQSPFSSPGAYF